MANSKKSVVQFTASWLPGEKGKEDTNLGFSGVIQVVEGKPTDKPAHVVLREYEDGNKPSWWPGITDAAKQQVFYGPAFADEEPWTTNLHQVKIEKGAVFEIKANDGTVRRYRIDQVEDLTV